MHNHRAPENCYVCGYSEADHHDITGHTFWSNAAAKADFAKQPEPANYSPEAAYVEQHRPY